MVCLLPSPSICQCGRVQGLSSDAPLVMHAEERFFSHLAAGLSIARVTSLRVHPKHLMTAFYDRILLPVLWACHGRGTGQQSAHAMKQQLPKTNNLMTSKPRRQIRISASGIVSCWTICLAAPNIFQLYFQEKNLHLPAQLYLASKPGRRIRAR